MLTSARNQFRGKVIGIKAGAVNDEVAIKLPGGTELTAVITCTSTKNLGLAPGKDVIALIKAPWVILATNLEGIRLSARNQLKGTVTATNDELGKLSVVTEDVSKVSRNAVVVSENASQLSTLFTATLGGPLVKTAAFTHGVRQAIKGTRKAKS